MLIDGKKIAENIISSLRSLPKPDRMLAAVLVGDNAQAKSFLRQKERIAQELAIPFHLYQFDESIPETELVKEVQNLGADPEIGGIIVQLPLPPHYNRNVILEAINPKKDIDAMTPESRKFVLPLPVEVVKDVLCAVNGAENSEEFLKDKIVAVVGRGFLVGKPIMDWLDAAGIKYSLFHSKSDLGDLKYADVIITGVGKGGLITPEILKNDVGVIDFGYDLVEGKIKGDFSPDENFSGWYTPTPGGTGPVLVAEIFKNFYKLNS